MDTALLDKLTREMLVHLDAKDFTAVASMMAPNCQAVDEISGHWLRGADEVGAYLDELGDRVSEITSTLDDVSATDLGNAGVVTGTLRQTYREADHVQTITAPLTAMFVRDQGHWQIALMHAVALPTVTG